jgi:hypothetical protein
MILLSGQVLYNTQAILETIPKDSLGGITRYARWMRAALTLLLHRQDVGDEQRFLQLSENVLKLLKRVSREQVSGALFVNKVDMQQQYPELEVEWIMSKCWNRGLEARE